MKLFKPALSAVICLLLSNLAALAHVQLNKPNGGEILYVGDTTTIEWQVQVQHNTQTWHLSYSVTGPAGPWLPIAENLPVGDPSLGAIHTYQWEIPGTISTEVRVRAIQDNDASDYADFSNADLTIADPPPPCCLNTRGNANNDPDDNITVADISYLVSYLFGIPSGPAPQCAEEANANGDPAGDVTVSDISYLIAYLFGIPTGPAPSACP